MSQKEVICNLCHAKVERVLFDWGITSVMKCDRCGLVFRRIVMELSERELYNFAEKMCDMSHSPTAKYSAAYSEDDSRVMLWKSYLEELDKLNVSEGRKLLDIGSAKGVSGRRSKKRLGSNRRGTFA